MGQTSRKGRREKERKRRSNEVKGEEWKKGEWSSRWNATVELNRESRVKGSNVWFGMW